MCLRKILVIYITFTCLVSTDGFASDFGTSGLITLPSARMKEDGYLTGTVSKSRAANIFNLTYQATPRIETTFRYSIFNPDKVESSIDDLKDRSYGVKLRLTSEKEYIPQIALGVRDMLGTGAWAGEYLVATKRIRQFDVTAGIGTGRFAERSSFENPLGFISKKFEERPVDSGGDLGGKIRGNTFFRGDVGLFGGFSYALESVNMRFIVQYSSDSYAREVARGTIVDTSPLSFGVDWNFTKNAKAGFSYLNGEYYGLNLAYSLDTKTNPSRKSPRPFYSSLSGQNLDPELENLNFSSWYDRALYDFERSGLKLNKASFRPPYNAASLEVENTDYVLTSDAVRRAILLADLHLPRSTARLNIHILEKNQSGPTITLERGNYYKSVGNRIGSFDLKQIDIERPSKLINPTNITSYELPKVVTSANLATRLQLFDPQEPLRKQLYMKLVAELLLPADWKISGIFGVDIYNDFSTSRLSDSVLPHVRTDNNFYLTEGESGIDALFVERRGSLNGTLHYRTYAGLLEEMFSGVGGETLFHIYDRRWAIGGSVNWVKQRGYEKKFEHLGYETVTGFLSFYYATPFRNYDAAVHIGKYLAKDFGYTVEVRRSFDNGFEIGGFFSKTNVSAEDFGEGSFDKGLYFRIPLDAFVKRSTRSSYKTELRSVNRDGGRRLTDFGQTLWFDRRAIRSDAIARTKNRVLGG